MFHKKVFFRSILKQNIHPYHKINLCPLNYFLVRPTIGHDILNIRSFHSPENKNSFDEKIISDDSKNKSNKAKEINNSFEKNAFIEKCFLDGSYSILSLVIPDRILWLFIITFPKRAEQYNLTNLRNKLGYYRRTISIVLFLYRIILTVFSLGILYICYKIYNYFMIKKTDGKN